MFAVVEGHPAEEVRLLRGRTAQGTADLRRVRAAEQGVDVFVHVGGENQATGAAPCITSISWK